MTEINQELIAYLERLSLLNLTENEKIQTEKDLQNILGYMDKLSALNTEGAPVVSHPFPSGSQFREDTVKVFGDTARILEGAPKQNGRCFVAPKAIE